jgi:TetR/AcrR family acrAB operon transcriptional repressor
MYVYHGGMRRTKREAEATRGALVDAALRAFAEHGYAASTLADIAARAGVTRGAAYHHFQDKAELYLATIAHHWKEAAGPIWEHLDDPGAAPIERLRRFLVAYLVALERDERFRSLLEVQLFRTEALPELEAGMRAKAEAMRAWAEQLTAVLAQAAERGELRSGLTPRVAALGLMSYATGVATTFLVCPDLVRPAEDAEELADALLAGIR